MQRSWDLYDDAASAAEDALAMIGVEVAKASPLTKNGFEQLVRQLVKRMVVVSVPDEKAHMQKVARELDKNWTSMTPVKRGDIIRAATKAMAIPPRPMVIKVTKELATGMAQVVTISKRATATKYGMKIQPSFNQTDRKVVQHAADAQAHFITDKWGNRAETFSATARQIVEAGVKAGAGRQDIGRELRKKAIDPELRKSEAYYRTVAAIHLNRSRTFGSLSSLQEAGIDQYRFMAVMDEVTTDQCRFLNGQVFSVQRALDRYHEVSEHEDPEAVRDLQPWIRSAYDDKGRQVLYVESFGKRHLLAQVSKSGEGVADRAGTYTKRASVDTLEKLGVSAPPCHPNCRSDFIPA